MRKRTVESFFSNTFSIYIRNLGPAIEWVMVSVICAVDGVFFTFRITELKPLRIESSNVWKGNLCFSYNLVIHSIQIYSGCAKVWLVPSAHARYQFCPTYWLMLNEPFRAAGIRDSRVTFDIYSFLEHSYKIMPFDFINISYHFNSLVPIVSGSNHLSLKRQARLCERVTFLLKGKATILIIDHFYTREFSEST